MRNFGRYMAGLSALALGVLVFGFGTQASDSAAVAPEPGFDEVSRTFYGADGTLGSVTVLIDPSLISEEDALKFVLPDYIPGTVSASYALLQNWHPSAIPVVVRYNDKFDPYYLDGAAAAQWAMNTWNAVKDQSFRFEMGEPTDVVNNTQCGKDFPDGINSLRFGEFDQPGILGITCGWYRLYPDGGRHMGEFDMQITTTRDWWVEDPTPFNRFDLKSTFLHEFGHALGLAHSNQGTVMKPFGLRGEQNRVLSADDIAGIRALYGTTPTATPSSATGTPTKTPTQGPSATPTATGTPSSSKPFRLFAPGAGRAAAP